MSTSKPDVPRAIRGIRDGMEARVARERRRAIASMAKTEGRYQLTRARRSLQNKQPPVPVQNIEQGVAKVRRRAVLELAKGELEYQGDRLERALERAEPAVRKIRNRSEAARRAWITRKARGK